MTNDEIQDALESYFQEASGPQQDGVAAVLPTFKFDQIGIAPMTDAPIAPRPQGSSLDMATLKSEVSEREQAQNLLRAARNREPAQATVAADQATPTQGQAAVNVNQLPMGVAVRLYPATGQDTDLPGPGGQIHIIDPVTKKVVLSQG